jgi:hypothetical protein
MLKYGFFGNLQLNKLLLEAINKKYLLNMILIATFQLVGIRCTKDILVYCQQRYKGGDIKIIHDFLLEVATKIALTSTAEVQIARKI